MEMSDEARFGFQDLDVDNNDLVLSVNDQFLNKKGGTDKKDFIKKLNIGQPNQQAAISSERHAAASSTKCPSHPEEDFQFYCFNKDQLLCPECLVSGKYAGYEISNLKKAAEKLKGKFNSVIVEAIGKFQAYSQIEEEVEGYEEEIERAASTYEEVIVKQMDEIRQKINNKEQEMLQNILSVRQERLNELKSSTKWLQNYREEIESVKETENDELSSLDDLQVCKYYSKKATVMKSFLQNDNSFKTQAIKENVEAYQIQDQSNLSKFLEDCKGLKLSLDSIKGPETGRARQNTGNSTKETFRASGASYFLASSETITNNIRKDSREVSLPFNTLPNKLVIPPKATFLPKQGNEEIIELNSLLKSPTNKVFEKHLAKVHEIRKPTPKKDVVSETRFTPKESKRSEAVNSLMIEMRRGNSSKRTNVSGISFHNDTSSILDTYKEILTKRTTGIDSKTPKTYMISINNPTPTKPFNSALSSPNNIIQASSSIYSNVSPKESRERNSKIARNNYEIFASEINRSSIKTFLKESDSVHNLNFDKMLMRRKANERNGTVSSSDIGLKKKLNQLSNELFK